MITKQFNVQNFLDKRYYFTGQPCNSSSADDPLTLFGSAAFMYSCGMSMRNSVSFRKPPVITGKYCL